MAVFNHSDDLAERLDWKILQNGWASLYWRPEVLNRDLEWFKKEKFETILFDCSGWGQTKNIHKALKKQLHFPDYYGENINALNDCLSDLQINDNGLVIVFEKFHLANKDYAFPLLDTFADNARKHVLFGKKLITLIQTDDPGYQIEPIGACSISWNFSEWLNKDRGL